MTGIGQIKNKTERSPKNESSGGAASDGGILWLLSQMNMGTTATKLPSLEMGTRKGATFPMFVTQVFLQHHS